MPLQENHNMDMGDTNSHNLLPQGVVHAVDMCSQWMITSQVEQSYDNLW